MSPTLPMLAQTSEEMHHHEHHKNEIAIANSMVLFVQEKELAYGLHLHYIRNISHSKFGIGLAYERIFDEHGHNTIGFVGAFRPIEPLTLSISPGLAFEDKEKEVTAALHFETAYEFEIKNFHIGPSIEFAFDPKDIHISLGVHIGYGF